MRVGRLLVLASIAVLCCSPAASAADKSGAAPNVKVVVNKSLSTNTRLVLDVSLPGKTHTTQVLYKAPDGKTYVKIAMPGLTTSFDPKQTLTAGLGTPGVPALSIPFAIPQSSSASDRAHGVFSKVSTQVLQAYYDDVTLKQSIYPALKAPLDGPSAATGHATITSPWAAGGWNLTNSFCSISALRAIPICWGYDQINGWEGKNSIQDWLTNPPSGAATQVDQIMHGQWNQIAVGTNGAGGQTNTWINTGCLVGQTATDVAYGVNINRLNCFAINPEDGRRRGTKDFPWMLGIGDDPRLDIPGYDIKQVEASAGSDWPDFGPAEFCVLRNYGTTGLPAGYTPGHGEIRCFGRDDGDRSPFGGDWRDPAMTDPVTGEPSHYTQLSIGLKTGCGLLATGHVRCWGVWSDRYACRQGSDSSNIDNCIARKGPLFQPEMTQISMGDNSGCGIRRDNSRLFCWLRDMWTRWDPSVSAEQCVARGGVVTDVNYCEYEHVILPPSLSTLQVKSVTVGGGANICVTDLEDVVHCDNPNNPVHDGWNPAPLALPSFVNRNKFTSLRLIDSVGCGVTIYERIFCWPATDDKRYAGKVPIEVNSPIAWHDPLFQDFVNDILYQNMPDDLLRPFKQDGLSYGSPLPIPSGTVSKSGGAVTGDNKVSGASSATDTQATPSKGGLRGLGLGQLYLYGGQYTPKTKKIRVFSKVRVAIDFQNPQLNAQGKAVYGDASVSSPSSSSFRQVAASTLVNADTALGSLTPPPVPRRRKVNPAVASTAPCGEDMLVVTAADFQSQAETFAAAKNKQGMLTRVATVGEPRVGTSAESIRTFVQGEMSKTDSSSGVACTPPAYLMLLGNTEKVPTFTGDSNTTSTPSDMDYTLPSLNTYVPDMAVGRLPAASGDQATAMVNKILAYESAAPTSNANFYNNVTITSFFQNANPLDGMDTRGFVRSAEQLRNGLMVKGAGKPGKTVERLYATSNPTSRIKLTKDDLGRSFPTDLQKQPNQAPWNSGTQGSIIKSIQAGRFLVISRDHGDFDRIFNPAYGNFPAPGSGQSSVDQMSNGSMEPVAWLIACLAGSYDNPKSPSFAESMLARPAGGMVGVLAASRVSPSEPNNSLLLALGDAVWPSILPTGNAKPIYRMGDVLNAAKLQVLMSGGPKASYDINNEMRLYNWFGDPSMQLWTQKPAALPLTVASSGATPDYAFVSFKDASADGAKAVLLGPGDQPLGSTIIKGTAASVAPVNGIADSGVLKFVIVKDQALPTTVTIRR